MAAHGHFPKKIQWLRGRANVFRGLARRRHFRAALLARKALIAEQNGHHLRSHQLLVRALRTKAAAARAGFRSRLNRWRIARVRRAQRLHAQAGCAAARVQVWKAGRHAAPKILVHPTRLRALRLGAPRFDPVASPATLAGSTPHFHVYYAGVLGQSGDKVAQDVLKSCERDYENLSGLFGQQQPMSFNIIIAPLSQQMDGTGGAYHHTCPAIDLYCDVQLMPTINSDVTKALVVAEEVEVFEAIQGGGWNCGASNGEGLSRVLASELYPNVLENLGYFSARFWLNSRRPNFVGRTLSTDRSMIGNGCSVLFLNYLHTQLGIGWGEICQAAAPTLAGTYKTLTGKTAPFPAFAALLESKFPKGQRTNLSTDNPFPIGSAALGDQQKSEKDDLAKKKRLSREKE